MKIAQLNATCGIGSTGKICVSISELLNKNGIENYILYTQGKSDYPNGIKYASGVYTKMQALKARLFGNYGFNSVMATRRLLAEIDKIKPDIIHIHNIHGHNVNFELLFEYLKERQIKVVYTFHDCWAFTGGCTHFTSSNCMRWKSDCGSCPLLSKYSGFFDRSKAMLIRKKQALNGLNMTVVTPSHWLADLVKESFLREYPVCTINNGINLKVFKPTNNSFKEKNNICGKMILGVAFHWNERKGLDVFIELARILPEEYSIVLVGTDDIVDKQLPKRIISIHKTNNQEELAEIYSAADVMVNPTREDNYPTVNMETLACGTPVVTFKVGGSTEMIDDTCGRYVEVDDIYKLVQYIDEMISEQEISHACLKKSIEFDETKNFRSYIELYKTLLND